MPSDLGGPRDTHVSVPELFILGNPISNFWESLSYAGKSIKDKTNRLIVQGKTTNLQIQSPVLLSFDELLSVSRCARERSRVQKKRYISTEMNDTEVLDRVSFSSQNVKKKKKTPALDCVKESIQYQTHCSVPLSFSHE